MKRSIVAAMFATGLMVAAPAISQPEPWTSVNQRQAQVEDHIDRGVRDGSLTPAEAANLRQEFRRIADLEAQYRRSGGGLTAAEQMDLTRRMDALAARVRLDRNDAQVSEGWTPVNQRQAEIQRRLEAGVADRSLTRAEADFLRTEFNKIDALEVVYRRDGVLSRAERADLQTRLDNFEQRLTNLRRNSQTADISVDTRQGQVQDRIEQGVRSGGLTPVEAARLRDEFHQIAELEAFYRRDNVMASAERADLIQRLNVLDAKVVAMTHNVQRR